MAMSTAQDILELEKTCEQLYSAKSPQDIHKANEILENFGRSSECLTKSRMLLDRGTSPYSQYIACNVLIKAITRNSVKINVNDKYELRCYVLNYLYSQTNLTKFVANALNQLYAKITKYSWFDTLPNESGSDQPKFREILSDISRFVQGPTYVCVKGIKLLSELLNEINQLDETELNRSLTKHRKMSSSFRDTQLLEIFTMTCTLLQQANQNVHVIFGNNATLDNDPDHQDSTFIHNRDLISHLLELMLYCLQFDFIGSNSNDDNSDDLSTIQIPNTWRPIVMDFSNIQMFYNLYFHLPTDLAFSALSCIVQFSAIRRSFFSNVERIKYLHELCFGIKRILETSTGLDDSKCYHEFCRLLARLKCNYQLSELIKLEFYPELLQMLAKFTIKSLQMWRSQHVSSNSVFYLLSLWQRMVASIPYIKSQEPHLLEQYTPEITSVYITSRLEIVEATVKRQIEDPFDDLANLFQQLEQISIVGRCEYEQTCKLITSLFDETGQKYQSSMLRLKSDTHSATGNFDGELTVLEDQLTWLVYIIGGMIGGRVTYSCSRNDEYDVYDGELVVRVHQLMTFVNVQLENSYGYSFATKRNEKLDLAILNYFDQFRKIFLGDQAQKSSKIYQKMSEMLGIHDETMWLNLVTTKIILNLKYWTKSERIIKKTLSLFNELCVGYSSVRKMMKLESIHYILVNHNSENFPFLAFENMPDLKCHSMFYMALGRLLNLDFSDDDETFDQFIKPLSNRLNRIGQMMSESQNNSNSLNEIKVMIIGSARDLRGLAFSFNSRAAYMQLFDWLYPHYLPLFTKAIELWHAEPFVTTTILKLFAELVQNRSQRLTFDISSPNGILLFREASRVVCLFGAQIHTEPPSSIRSPNEEKTTKTKKKDDFYERRLKGISICFNILKYSLSGGYVNFGVFKLYNDYCLTNAFEVFIKLLLSFQKKDLAVYVKLSLSYHGLLETLSADHMEFIAMLEPDVFVYILSTISDGLGSINSIISTNCCATLDHIITYLFKSISKQMRKPDIQSISTLVKIYQQESAIFEQLFVNVMNIIIYDDCRNQWSMSRPLLGLILLNEQAFERWRLTLIRSQFLEKRDVTEACINNLMNGIDRSLSMKNRDKFTQNVATFRRDIIECIKSNSSGALVVLPSK